jgi:glycosyltransferase involved in cell wall biosynthesis
VGGVKLALVVPGGVDRSGEYRVIPALLALIERLSRQHEVHVFALRQEPLAGDWRLAGASIHNIGDGWVHLRGVAAIRAEHRRAPFDLVHAVFSGPCGLIAVAAARLLALPSMVHVTGGELLALRDIGYGGRQTWKGRMREWITLRCAGVVTASSSPVVELLGRLGIAALRVPLGVDLLKWPPLAPHRRPAGPARLLHIASLNRVKDQSTLLHALALLDVSGVDFAMDIVGSDTLRGEMMDLACRLHLDGRVRFLGFKTQQQLRPIVEAANLLVVSSRHEAGPFVVLEAAVAGVPTVGTAVGHIVEWAPAAALAVSVADPERLAGAIRIVLADEELRLRVARVAQCRALSQDADYTARTFETLYLRLAGAHGHVRG